MAPRRVDRLGARAVSPARAPFGGPAGQGTPASAGAEGGRSTNRGQRRLRDLRLGPGGCDLHGSAIAEDRQIAEDHLLRAVDRCPGPVEVRLDRALEVGDLDPLAVADSRPDFGPHGAGRPTADPRGSFAPPGGTAPFDSRRADPSAGRSGRVECMHRGRNGVEAARRVPRCPRCPLPEGHLGHLRNRSPSNGLQVAHASSPAIEMPAPFPTTIALSHHPHRPRSGDTCPVPRLDHFRRVIVVP